MAKKRSKFRLRYPLLLIVLLAIAWGVWGALLRGPAVQVTLDADRTAIGPGTTVTARFQTEKWGLGTVRLEIEQGACRAILAEEFFERPSSFELMPRSESRQFELTAVVGRENPGCLEEGDVVIRAMADRVAGPLRGQKWSQTELTLPAIFRPPSIQVLSTRHYVRQGGSGIVVFRTTESAVRSGVRVGETDLGSFLHPEREGARFSLYGIPWHLADRSEIKLYAEDAAGNRSEAAFVDLFKAAPPRKDTIRLPDSFLERVVPAIASQTAGFDADGTLLDQYVRINRDLRVANRKQLADLSLKSQEQVFWNEPFLQQRNSARRAGYAETRSYRYSGREVDVQTHLGLDLASVARAPVEAPNAGQVMLTGYLGIYGNAVVLDHGYGMLSICAHLSSVEVSEGQIVDRGQILGRTGATGLAGGDHLHLGIFIQGVAVDPMEWLDGTWIQNRILPDLPKKAPAQE